MTSTWLQIIQEGIISTLGGKPLKLVNQFIYLGSNISSTENHDIIGLTQRGLLLTGYRPLGNLFSVMKLNGIFPCGSVHITIQMHRMDATETHGQKAKWQQHDNPMYFLTNPGTNPTKQQFCNHLPPISQTIQVRRTRHAGHRWRSKDELISDVL